MMEELMSFYNTDPDFNEYITKDMKMYGRTLEQSLKSPITKNYYNYLIDSRRDKIIDKPVEKV